MKKSILFVILVMAGTVAQSATTNLIASADTGVYQRDAHAWETTNVSSALSMDLHQESSLAINFFAYIQFDLSSLGSNVVINSATLTLTQINPNPDELNTTRSRGTGGWSASSIIIYGLNNMTSNTAQNWAEGSFNFNATGDELDEASAKTADPFKVASGRSTSFSGNTFGNDNSPVGTDTSTLTGPTLVNWLQQRADDNGYATFMVETSVTTSTGIYSKEGAAAAGNNALAPTLTVDYYSLLPKTKPRMIIYEY